MKVFKAPAVALTLLSLLLFSGTADARPKRRIEGFSVDTSRAVSVNGQGCPASSVTGIINGSDVAVIFTKFGTTASPGSTASVNCNIVVPLNIPSGYTVEPTAVAYQGSVGLTDHGFARVRTVLSWGGRSRTHDNFRLDKEYGSNYVGGWQRNLEARVGGGVKACKGRAVSDFRIDTTLIANAERVKSTVPVSLDLSTTDIGFGAVVYTVEFEFIPCS